MLFQPVHRLGVHIETLTAGLGDETPATDTDIDDQPAEMLTDQLHPGEGQRRAHGGRVE
ncbi:hypothetical protein D3C76_1793920 [compost metagenome]